MKVALVCSWLNQYGGAERVLEVMHELFPDAPIYTSMFEPKAMPPAYRAWQIRTSFMQRLPFARRHHQFFLPFYPLAFEQMDLTDYDVVISNTSGFAHAVITRPDACHICYCLTPARFLWNYTHYASREAMGRTAQNLLAPLISLLRMWDSAASNRVDHFVAISQAVSSRIKKFYRRDSTIVYPPVDTSDYRPGDDCDNFFLVVSRLVPYKRIELAIQACTELGLPLKVVGDGRYRPALQKLAGPSVEFLGRVDDATVKQLYARCQAHIFPGEEDFGLTPLEAQASGRPVVAFAGGGALETVIEGVTGAFFQEPTAASLAEILRNFRAGDYDSQRIRAHAKEFDVASFKTQLTELVLEKYAEHQGRPLVLRS